MKKIILILLTILFILPSIYAEETQDLTTGTTNTHGVDVDYKWGRSMLNPLDPFRDFGEFTTDNPLRNLFYPVESWETEWCTRDKITDYPYDDTEDTSRNTFYATFFDTASTLQVEKTIFTDDILYELSWYVHPKTETEVKIYLYSKNQTKWIKVAEQTVPAETTWGEYVPYYSSEIFTKAKISFPNSENDFITNVVTK
jgi:hypothetical protein